MAQPELEAVIHSDTYVNYHWIQRALILRECNLVKNVRQLKGALKRETDNKPVQESEMWSSSAMITFHFHLQPQYKYELFHINFTSFHCTGRYELNKLTSLPMCGFIAQLVEHRTGIAEVTGSNSVEALIFFFFFSGFFLPIFLRWSHFTFIYNRSTNMNYFI